MTALNMVAAQILAILVVVAVREGRTSYLDVALVYDIFGFIGTLAMARYFSRYDVGRGVMVTDWIALVFLGLGVLYWGDGKSGCSGISRCVYASASVIHGQYDVGTFRFCGDDGDFRVYPDDR